VAFAVAVFIIAAGPAARFAGAGSTWPTLHNDYQRSGYTSEVVAGPYERKWFRDFHDEMIASRVEAIVAEGKCFVGTFAGHLYALNVADGSTAWQFKAGGPIGYSPCYHDGNLYFGADEGFDKGHLYCVRAGDGSPVWRYETPAGVWSSPACDGEKVYVGDRSGLFHAVDIRSGRRAWTYPTGDRILTPASFSPDGKRIVFGSEDMHAYCLDPAGGRVWQSPKLPGLSLRDHPPTIWKGLVIVRTNPADGFHEVMNRNGDLLKRTQQAIALGPDDKVLLDKWGDLMMKETPERRRAEQEAVVRYLKENPRDRTFFAFALEDGKEPWVAPVFYTCGLHNPPTHPAFHPKTGDLYVYYRTALTNCLRGVRRYNALGRLHRETGLIDWSYPEYRHKEAEAFNFPMIGDETQALSFMGDRLEGTHQGDLCALDLKAERATPIWQGRDTYGGIFGPAAVKGSFDGARKLAEEGFLTGMPNEWHGPDRAILAIADGRLFWVVGSQVVCLGGPNIPRTETGGTKPPPTFKSRLPFVGGGNLVDGTGKLDESVEKIRIEPKDLQSLLDDAPKAVAQANSRLAKKLRARLDAEVNELVNDGPWAPLIVELGIAHERIAFQRTAEEMQIVALALPHLSPAVREAAVGYLDRSFAAGRPLRSPLYKGDEGKRREIYDFGPGMRDFAKRAATSSAGGTLRSDQGIEDLYAVWAYAHYADRWDKVLAEEEVLRAAFNRFAAKPVAFDHNDNAKDAAERLNAQLAGTLAFARIMAKAGKRDEVERALARLADLATERVHHERADSWLVRVSGHRHSNKVPRYGELTPELGGLLRRYANEPLARHVRGLAKQLPLWYQAFGERMIGGENYTQGPEFARGLFAALADGLEAPPDELARFLDQPWGAADLYSIEKLSAMLRRFQPDPQRSLLIVEPIKAAYVQMNSNGASPHR
jgi:hypothetical protein